LNACGGECVDAAKKHGIENWEVFGQAYPDRDRYPGTAPVGSFPAGNGRWGNGDLSGNVKEFIEDETGGPCGGDFVWGLKFSGEAVDYPFPQFRSDSCSGGAALYPDGGDETEGFRCASGGRAVRLDAEYHVQQSDGGQQ
jgi:formylglycine-generating enzyme required for sulfatase activity